jgi:hypothetical protein
VNVREATQVMPFGVYLLQNLDYDGVGKQVLYLMQTTPLVVVCWAIDVFTDDM